MNPLHLLSVLATVAACSASNLHPILGHHVSAVHGPALAVSPLTVGHHVPALTHAVAPAAVHSHLSHSAPVTSQYHSQDELGQYSFGYNGGPSSRAESRDAYGNVRGSYSYVDSYGKLQTQHYVADGHGFRVLGSNLPVHGRLHKRSVAQFPASTGPLATVSHVAHHSAPVASVAHHVAPVAHHVAPVAHHVAPVAHHVAPVAHHVAPVAHHVAPVAHHVAPVAHHVAPVTHHVAPVTYGAHAVHRVAPAVHGAASVVHGTPVGHYHGAHHAPVRGFSYGFNTYPSYGNYERYSHPILNY